MEAGSLTFQLVDEDGDALPGDWSYEWSGRDPLELTVFAVTELSAKPWRWTSRRLGRAFLATDRCKPLSIRVGKCLKKEVRTQASTTIARIIAQECLRPGQTPPDVRIIADILAGRRDADWDAGPQESVPAMMRALRNALKAAAESEAGLLITWGEED